MEPPPQKGILAYSPIMISLEISSWGREMYLIQKRFN
jgi:hypothetical protein